MEINRRGDAEDIFRAAVKAADPYAAVKSRTGGIRDVFDKEGFKRLIIAGFGKASAKMAKAIEEDLDDIITGGAIITKYGHLGDFSSTRVRAYEAGHPVPDERGLEATGEIIALLQGADEMTLVVCLVSGGGSALLVAPQPGITLAEKQELTGALLASGASIHEVNSVRKHISAVKGGRLARLAWPGRVVSLIVSDVVGDDLGVIASGPTAPDPTTFGDALAVLRKYSVATPPSIARRLERGFAGHEPETPREGDDAFQRVENIIVADNRTALGKALERATELGYRSEVISDAITGDITQAARFLLEEAKRHRKRPACVISGGETTVKVKGKGRGGRNMHLALFFAMAVEGRNDITLLSAGTDGTDGPTDAAGAVVNGSTVSKARQAGLTPEEYFSNNDSYAFFGRTGEILITGPTGTNVMDIQVMILE